MALFASAGLTVAGTVLAASTAAGWWWRRLDGRLRAPNAAGATQGGAVRGEEPPDLVDPALRRALGVPDEAVATLLQFSSAFCAPCRATRRVCAEVAGMLDGVRHVEVDAESHLDAVRALRIWRTPTVLLLDGGGRIVRRATGVPAKAQVIAAVAPVLSGERTQPNGAASAGRWS